MGPDEDCSASIREFPLADRDSSIRPPLRTGSASNRGPHPALLRRPPPGDRGSGTRSSMSSGINSG